MSKLVSVLVPTIGRPQYIKNTITSILNQDYNEIEVLISDNLPAISTKSILGDKIDPRIKIIERDRRYGFSEHMNLCINDASGYYVMILSDDDLICSNYISSMIGLFDDNEGVMVGLGLQNIIGEDNTSLDVSEMNDNVFNLFDGTEYSLNCFRGKLHLPIYTYISLFARKMDMLAAGGFQAYPDGSNADNYLFYSLALQGKVGISNCLMGYRVYPSSSGLSTAFEKLYLATWLYDRDVSSLFWNQARTTFLNKCYLRLWVKLSSTRMLKCRLFSIYKNSFGRFSIAINLLRVIFCFFPRNIFFGFWNSENLK
jgi:glycosyltransferase involved in cell wall biosynthesis